MKGQNNKLIIILTFFSVLVIASVLYGIQSTKRSEYGAPPYIEDNSVTNEHPFDFSYWKRPDGPLRVGLQAGHWKTSEMPEELERIRESGGGTKRGLIAEWQVALKIAEETALLLREKGIEVDILPATVPVDYWADAFVSIHADGSLDLNISGYKVAAYRRDITGKAQRLSNIIDEEYQALTGLRRDPNITRNMTGYYAFNWRRYDHAVHPMTPAVILETGFLTNPSDANLLINRPHIPAKALADSLIKFLGVE